LRASARSSLLVKRERRGLDGRRALVHDRLAWHRQPLRNVLVVVWMVEENKVVATGVSMEATNCRCVSRCHTHTHTHTHTQSHARTRAKFGPGQKTTQKHHRKDIACMHACIMHVRRGGSVCSWQRLCAAIVHCAKSANCVCQSRLANKPNNATSS
jgi:hypothetical protein